MTERHVVGDVVRIKNTFTTDSNGTYIATDPTAVTLDLVEPGGSTVSYTNGGLTNSATGVWQVDYTVSTNGLWTFTFEGDSPAADVTTRRFAVYAVAPPDDILTLDEARRAVGMGVEDGSRLDLLALVNAGVTAKIDQAAGPVVNRTISTEIHEGNRQAIKLRFAPVDSLSTVTEYTTAGTGTVLSAEDYDTKPTSGYRAHPVENGTGTFSGVLERRSGTSASTFAERVVVTYVAGRITDTELVADKFKNAATLTLKNLWRTFETSAAEVGEYDLPFQTFPSRYAMPDPAKSEIADEIRGVSIAPDDSVVMIG